MNAVATKRALDLALAVPAFVASLPLQVGAAAAIRLTMGRPVLFRQSRPGLNGEVFELVKFRTMALEDPERGLVTDAQRMTRLGSLLRSSSVDELPTLWNVIRGDMSIVGPRPLLPQYLPRYSPEQARRHEVRPGLTGLAQVMGRNSLSWEEKLKYDVAYVDTHTTCGDLRIMALTLKRVLGRHGISATGSATMPEFMGRQTST